MGTDIVDLQGQLMFLGAFPAMQKNVFENWFRGPLSRASHRGAGRSATLALAFLGSFMIRHTKTQRLGGRRILELPAKTEHTVQVTLAPAERAKYDEMHAKAKREFEAGRCKLNR